MGNGCIFGNERKYLFFKVFSVRAFSEEVFAVLVMSVPEKAQG
ncbi:hypothetical protein [Acetobacter papayae]|nr:hypothetical protein [Acetobacter papayae]